MPPGRTLHETVLALVEARTVDTKLLVLCSRFRQRWCLCFPSLDCVVRFALFKIHCSVAFPFAFSLLFPALSFFVSVSISRLVTCLVCLPIHRSRVCSLFFDFPFQFHPQTAAKPAVSGPSPEDCPLVEILLSAAPREFSVSLPSGLSSFQFCNDERAVCPRVSVRLLRCVACRPGLRYRFRSFCSYLREETVP